MQGNKKISTSQFIIVVTLFTIGSAILNAPSGLVFNAKQDAWIPVCVGIMIGLLLIWLYNTLCARFPSKTLVEINEILLGKWLGKLVSFIISFSFLLAASALLFFLGNFLTTQIITETPIETILIIFTLIIVQGARLGIETISRAAELLFPWFIILFITLILFVSPQIEFLKLQPVLETGIKPIISATLLYLNFSSLPLISLLMIYPSHINQPKQAAKAFFAGHIMGGIVLLIITLLCILVLGVEHSERNLYPSYVLARKISVGGFIQHIEAILATLWFITLYFKITHYFYASVLGIAQTLHIKEYRLLSLPLGILLVVTSLIMYPNVTYERKASMEAWTPHLLTIGLLLPLLLLVVAIIRKKGSITK